MFRKYIHVVWAMILLIIMMVGITTAASNRGDNLKPTLAAKLFDDKDYKITFNCETMCKKHSYNHACNLKGLLVTHKAEKKIFCPNFCRFNDDSGTCKHKKKTKLRKMLDWDNLDEDKRNVIAKKFINLD